MASVTLEGKEYPVKFNIYAFKLMFEATGANLFDGASLNKVSQALEGNSVKEYEFFAAMAYAGIAGAEIPTDAPPDWKPSLSLNGVMSKLTMSDSRFISEITTAYMGKDLKQIEEEAKNSEAPVPIAIGTGQESQ
jgi:hypothetical protein